MTDETFKVGTVGKIKGTECPVITCVRRNPMVSERGDWIYFDLRGKARILNDIHDDCVRL